MKRKKPKRVNHGWQIFKPGQSVPGMGVVTQITPNTVFYRPENIANTLIETSIDRFKLLRDKNLRR